MQVPKKRDNTIYNHQAKQQFIDVFIYDTSGALQGLENYTSVLYMKKFPVNPDAPVDLSTNHWALDPSNGKITFNLGPYLTNLEEGDYVYEVKMYSAAKTYTVVQDTWKLMKSLVTDIGDFTLFECDVSFYNFNKLDTNVTVTMNTLTGWAVEPPTDWLSSTPDTGTGGTSFVLQVTDFSTGVTGNVHIRSPFTPSTIDIPVTYWRPYLSLEPSIYTFTPEDTSTDIQLTTDASNTWVLQDVPSWITPSATDGDGSLNIVLTADASSRHTVETITVDSSYAFETTSMDVSVWLEDPSYTPGVALSATDTSAAWRIETYPWIYWRISGRDPWLSINSAEGYGTTDSTFEMGPGWSWPEEDVQLDLSLIAWTDYPAGVELGRYNVTAYYIYNGIPDYGDLKGYWTFDNTLYDYEGRLMNIDGSISYDPSGVNNECINSGSWGDDGANYDFTPDEFRFSNNWSVAYWIKTDISTGAFQQLEAVPTLAIPRFSGWNSEIIQNESAGDLFIRAFTGFTGSISTTSLTANAWHHIAWSVNNYILSFYIDASLQGTLDFSGSSAYPGGSIIILDQGGGAGASGNALFDELYVYDTAIDASAVLDLYNRT